jgi:hypothetical protein
MAGTGNLKGRVQGQPPASASSAEEANAAARPETPKETNWLWEGSKFIPVVGAVPSLMDAYSNFQQGDYLGAALEAGGVIPVGKIFGTVGRLGRLAVKAAREEKAAAKIADAGGKILKKKWGKGKYPKDPKELEKEGWKDTTDPRMRENTNSREYTNPETGERVRFDQGDPKASGYASEDHWHQYNNDATSKGDYYLDQNGVPTSKGSNASHIPPSGP